MFGLHSNGNPGPRVCIDSRQRAEPGPIMEPFIWAPEWKVLDLPTYLHPNISSVSVEVILSLMQSSDFQQLSWKFRKLIALAKNWALPSFH